MKKSVLEGNGAGFVRELALAGRVQGALERLYRLERAADIDGFVTAAAKGERETLFVRESDDGALEIRLRLPPLAGGLDPVCQIIEGVSHFVYLADRAARGREATQLELELQAEVDKYVVLAASVDGFDEVASQRLRSQLYEGVLFEHGPGTELGERYRVANDYARRFTARLERDYVSRARFGELHAELRRFFHLGQGEKLRAA